MSAIIINEYKELLLQKNKIEQILPSLPEGYISKKTIKEKQYYYLQKYKLQLAQIEARLSVLEEAAKLIDKSIARNLILLKLSCGMDSLSSVQKERSVAFANALNAIEGVHASETAQQNIDKWKAGDESFISIFKSTLNMYGFAAEV